MSTTVQHFMTAFDAIPDSDRETVLGELLIRNPTGFGDIPHEGFDEITEELFLTYDAEEADDSAPANS